ncbi:MAG: hypothetical protein IJV64_03975, partial [Oscillospiraceae bacterium]|nr:hypothetical protein [Oscillospiraceae bacterium]
FFKTGNPNAVIGRYANQIPIVKQLQDIGRKYGGDYDKAFREYAAQNGLDPDAIMGELRELGVC